MKATVSPTPNKVFHIVTFSAVIVIYILLNWIADTRIEDFLQHQNSIASKVASTTSSEITTYIQNRRNLLEVLNKSYAHELVELSKNPSNTVIRNSIREKMKLIFPELIEFTLATNSGEPLLPKISDFKVGGTCRRNIKAFSNKHLEAIMLHGNPKLENYHFDILTSVKLPNDEYIILFMSISTNVLRDILKNSPSEEHHLFLIQGSESRFIEISGEGHKDSIKRPKRLTAEEITLINANIKVMGTTWNLISTINPVYVQNFKNEINTQKYQLLFICFITAVLVSFLFYRTDKKRILAEQNILDQNAILEEKVADRTKELTYRATHDKLTNLINREEFERRVKEALSRAKSDNTESILMYLDLDQFKIVNDTAGHAAGDELLVQVGSLLKSQLRRGDTLARLGGDEFGILLSHCSLDRASSIAEQLRSLIHNYQFDWESYNFTIGVSIGIIQINDESPNLTELLSTVDAACYMAKDLGRNQFYIYRENDSLFQEKQSTMYRAEMALKSISDNQLELHGQKIFPITTDDGNDNWYEVLVRIKRDDKLIYPDMFIPALEKFGRISTLDSIVIKQSIAYLSNNPNVKLSVNLSGLSVTNSKIINTIRNAISQYKIDPKQLCFEMTESAAIGNLAKVKLFIHEIHQIGCLVALDDFGTGMSSFSYLSNLDIDYIKLDGSFVKDIHNNSLHHTMVDSINSIVTSMDKYVIAEYVENQEVCDKLKAIGVAYGQGYHIHRPEKLDDINIT